MHKVAKIIGAKEKWLKWVFIHSIIYLCTVAAVSIPVISLKIFILDLFIAILHFMIDLGKYHYIKNSRKQLAEKRIFIVDQMLHFICLSGISYVAVKDTIPMVEINAAHDFFLVTGISEMALGAWTAALLIVHKPANIFIQKMIKDYKPKAEKEEFKKDNNTGRLIGTIERIVMLVLLSMDQYSAIGLV